LRTRTRPRPQVERAVQYVDYNVVQLDYKNPDDHRMLQALARKYALHFSRPGNGVSHYIHMERFGKPGQTMLGADSHTVQAGCLGMIAIGTGGLDVAVVLGGHRTRSLARRWSKCIWRAPWAVPGFTPRTSSSSCCAV
jgi:aconitase A